MKKLLSLGLTLLLAVGCTTQPDNQSAYQIYSDAMDYLKDADKMAATMDTQLSMNVDEEVIDMNISMNLALDQSNSAQPQFTMETTTESAGTSLAINAYYLDSYFYMDFFGQKMKVKIDYNEALDQAKDLNEQAEIFTEEDFKNAKLSQEGDMTVMTLEPSETLKKSLSQQALEQAGVEDSELTIEETSFQLKFNKDGELKELFYELPLSMNVDGQTIKMDYSTHVIYTAFNDQVTLTFPDDLADYISTDLE